jgi:hypothetical protein
MSVYGPTKKVKATTQSLQAENFIMRSGDTMTGGLTIEDANLSVNVDSGGPELDIRQRSKNSENQLPSGIRIRRPDNTAHYQLGWSNGEVLTLYSVYGSKQRVVCEYTHENITSLAEPRNPSDCATKNYVDSTRKGNNDIYYNEQVKFSEKWEAIEFPSTYKAPTFTQVNNNTKIIHLKRNGLYSVTVFGNKLELDRRVDLKGSVRLMFNGERVDSSNEIRQMERYFDFSTIKQAKTDDGLQVEVKKTTKEELIMHIEILIQEL